MANHHKQHPVVPDKPASEAVKCELCERTFETVRARNRHVPTHGKGCG